MKCYKDSTGHLHRTQAEAKASGHPFEVEIVPNDQQGLIDYMNGLRRPEPSTTEEFIEIADYENGHPTVPFMGSRDPRAVFTCIHCGKANANG